MEIREGDSCLRLFGLSDSKCLSQDPLLGEISGVATDARKGTFHITVFTATL